MRIIKVWHFLQVNTPLPSTVLNIEIQEFQISYHLGVSPVEVIWFVRIPLKT